MTLAELEHAEPAGEQKAAAAAQQLVTTSLTLALGYAELLADNPALPQAMRGAARAQPLWPAAGGLRVGSRAHVTSGATRILRVDDLWRSA